MHIISNNYFRIPPGAENHRVTACWTAPQDIHLTDVLPHMHKRGKSMEIKVFYPDGRAEVLLNVPGYDFSWQTRYSFRQPVAIPKGTRFMVTGYLDNSVAVARRIHVLRTSCTLSRCSTVRFSKILPDGLIMRSSFQTSASAGAMVR